MSGIDGIKTNILNEARARAEDIVSDAVSRGADIVAEMRAEAEKEGQAALVEARKHAFDLVNRANSMAGLEERKKILAAKREMISEVFDRIEMSFSRMEPSEYAGLLASMAVSAGSEGGTIVFSEHDRQYARSVFSMLDQKLFVLSGDYTSDIPNGFMLCRDGVYTECSVNAAIAEHRRELETEIAGILFGDGGAQEG